MHREKQYFRLTRVDFFFFDEDTNSILLQIVRQKQNEDRTDFFLKACGPKGENKEKSN